MAEAAKESFITTSRKFISESVDELRKVHKPTREETIRATLGTILIMVFISLLLSLFDFVFGRLMEQLI
jgi:preprotein translocase SecE subunit